MIKYGNSLIRRLKNLLIGYINNLSVYLENLEKRLSINQLKYLRIVRDFLVSLFKFFLLVLKNIKPFFILLLIGLLTFWFMICFFDEKRKYDQVGHGFEELRVHSMIIEYFV